MEGVNLWKNSAYNGFFTKLWFLDPESYTGSTKPAWLPRFQRLHISDVITLHCIQMQKDSAGELVQSDTFFSELRHLDEQDDYLAVDGCPPLRRLKVIELFPDLFWKMFLEIFPPYDVQDDKCLALIMRPILWEECKLLFDDNYDKGCKKLIQVSFSTISIVDRMILGLYNISHDTGIKKTFS